MTKGSSDGKDPLHGRITKYRMAAAAAAMTVGAAGDASAAINGLQLYNNGGAGWGPISVPSDPFPGPANVLDIQQGGTVNSR